MLASINSQAISFKNIYVVMDHLQGIEEYHVTDDKERNHRFWQRDALAVNMDSRDKIE